MEARKNIFAAIEAERQYQDGIFGTQFDDKNTVNDWVAYISAYAGRAGAFTSDPEDQRKAMVKVAALAVAALEALDRNGQFAPRHFDQAPSEDGLL